MRNHIEKTIGAQRKPLTVAAFAVLCAASLLAQGAQAAQSCNTALNETTPYSRFTINADNTVTDKATGLIWMRCPLGQTGNDCSVGTPKQYKWIDALNEAATNHQGWRVPNIKELASIVEHKCHSPAINLSVFPNTTADSSVTLTTTPVAGTSDQIYGVGFSSGLSGRTYKKTSNGYLRLVRSAP